MQKSEKISDYEVKKKGKVFSYWKVVKVRKEHQCEACNLTIKRGDRAFVNVYRDHESQKYPKSAYYHYFKMYSIFDVKKWAPSDFREKICWMFDPELAEWMIDQPEYDEVMK